MLLAALLAFGPGGAMAAPVARGAEPPTAPILRIEAGMHTAAVNSIAVDGGGRLALTVSNDKTARLWELPSGRLLRVMRPPIGEGNEGKLNACALTPDGAVSAVGGWSGEQWDKSVSIYLFETATGRMFGRLDGLPNAVTDLAFSAQGRYLAAVLGGGWGLRVWETRIGREIASDASYGGASSYGVDWRGEDRLVTACNDGHLRLYQLRESGLNGLARQVVPGGRMPHGVRFSPDGARIAVGFTDSTNVAIVDATDLHFLSAPKTTGVSNGSLESVAWTRDGVALVAGGRWQQTPGKVAIRVWPNFALENPRDYVVATDAIMSLRGLVDGGIAFASSDVAWGILRTDGQRAMPGASPIADFREAGSAARFRVSADGTGIAFGYAPGGQEVARFAVAGRRVLLGNDFAGENFHGPNLKGLNVSNWKDDTAPKLGRTPLVLERFERSRGLAIGGDASSFVLGTNWYVRCFTAKGRERWKVLAPGTVWSVNLADGDRLAAAACGDGTIRWYRADTGRELLAFFPHADRQRWVAWTPEGYYDCSPGAEDLIGWHVNRGKEREADFHPASKFRNIYYRPDVIARVLRARDVGEALRQANRELGRPETRPEDIQEVITRLAPPVVELETGGVFGAVALPGEAAQVKVRYRVRRTGAEVPTKVTVRFNGRLVEVKAPLPAADSIAEVSVPLPAGMRGEVSLIAEHRLATGEAAVLRIERQPGKAAPRRPNLYVLAAGVADLKMNDAADLDHDGRVTGEELDRSGIFKDGELVLTDLVHAANDARQVADAFRAQKGGLYQEVVVKLLTDKGATTSALREALRDLARQAGPEDVAVFFFSGHGVVDAKAGFYLATYEADPKTPASSAMTGGELSTLLEGIKARTVLTLDTCHSGGALGGTRFSKIVTSPQDLTGLVNQLSSAEQGTIVFSSSAVAEESLEDPKKGGVFTQALREVLAVGPATGEPMTCAGMQIWLTRRVPEIVAALVKGVADAPQQTPVCVIPKGVPDFPLATKR